MKKVKIRFHTWYWGKWTWSGTNFGGSVVTEKTSGFELYDEEKHGWHHSLEYKNGQLKPPEMDTEK